MPRTTNIVLNWTSARARDTERQAHQFERSRNVDRPHFERVPPLSRNSATLRRDAVNSRHGYPDPKAGSVDSGAEFITTKQAAKRFGISTNTLRNWVAKGFIPCIRVGPKLLRFDPVEVDKLARIIDNRSA